MYLQYIDFHFLFCLIFCLLCCRRKTMMRTEMLLIFSHFSNSALNWVRSIFFLLSTKFPWFPDKKIFPYFSSGASASSSVTFPIVWSWPPSCARLTRATGRRWRRWRWRRARTRWNSISAARTEWVSAGKIRFRTWIVFSSPSAKKTKKCLSERYFDDACSLFPDNKSLLSCTFF